MTTTESTTSIEVYTAQIAPLEEQAKALMVNDDETRGLAIETGVVASRLAKNIDDRRLALTNPLNAELKSINGFYQPHIKLLDSIKEIVRKKINAYDADQERKHREKQQEVERLLAEKRQKEIEEAKKNGQAAPPVALSVPVQEAPTTVQSDTGSATRRKVWKAEITDMMAFLQGIILKKTPTDAIEIQNGFLNRMAAQYKQDGVYPGVRFYEEVTSSFNTKG